MSIQIRWLGTAGLELALDDYILLIDPFFTRPSKAAVLSAARVKPDAKLCAHHAPRADAILVTHPHYDHLLDVPEIMQRTGARAYGSPYTRDLLTVQGIPDDQVCQVHPGDQITAGPFRVEVFPAHHTPIPMARLLNGTLPDELHLPLRLSDYRMDTCYSFRIKTGKGEPVLMVGNHPVLADVLFVAPYHPGRFLENLLQASAPRMVVPIHWDDFTRPLSAPLRPMLITPAQGLRPRFPPLRRIDLEKFTRRVQRVLPNARVHLPEFFTPFELIF